MTDERPIPRRVRKLATDTAWNLIGLTAPMAVALVTIPLLINGLGRERFGLLSLIWMVVGYFGVFDLGLGRALTKWIAERLERAPEEVPKAFWTAMTLMFALGCVAGVIVYAIAPWLTGRALKIEEVFRPDALQAFRAVSLAMPALVTVTGLVGSLEACGRFRLINVVRIPMGAFTFAGPLLVIPFTDRLHPVVLVLLAGKLAEWAIYFGACLACVPAVRNRVSFDRGQVTRLLGFGGWMTITNIIQPLMVHIDRFLIGGIRSVGEVAYYVASAEIVVKFLIFPRAWVSVLFPAFAAEHSGRPDAAGALFVRSLRLFLAAIFPVVLLVVLFAPEGLTWWLGREYGAQSAPVMRWLMAGIFLFSLSYVPSSYLQGVGRPDLTARLHALELPFYLALASLMTRHYGINGAAMAWVGRAAFEFLFTAWLAGRRAPRAGPSLPRTAVVAALSLCLLAVSAVPETVGGKMVTCIVCLGTFGAIAWRFLLDAGDRRIVVDTVARVCKSSGRRT